MRVVSQRGQITTSSLNFQQFDKVKHRCNRNIIKPPEVSECKGPEVPSTAYKIKEKKNSEGSNTQHLDEMKK
jgi:hypothetical protein